MTDAMPRYPYFLSLFNVAVGVPLYFIFMYIKKYFELRSRQKLAVTLTQASINADPQAILEQKASVVDLQGFALPKYKLALINKNYEVGLLDAMASILAVFGGNGTTGPMQALLTQGVIPITMILCFVFLGTRYKFLQYYGAWIVLVGVFIVFAPQLFTPQADFYWPLITLSSTIPTAISTVFKEHSFKQKLVDVFYLQAWVSLAQFCSAVILFPLNLIPKFGNLSVSDVLPNLWGGLKCLGGQGSVSTDTCEGAWIPVAIYAVCNFIYNICSLYVVKEISSAVVYIQNTVRLPIVTIAFHLPFVVGSSAMPWDTDSYFTFGGLTVIIIGMLIYMYPNLRQLRNSSPSAENERKPLLSMDEECKSVQSQALKMYSN